MKHISKILLIVVAIVGLAIGMSAVASYDNSSNNINSSIFEDKDIMDSNCGSGKCGGDDAKADVKDAKCGEGKCGGDKADAKKQNFMGLDTNGDGKVSKAEFQAGHNKKFSKMDNNNDGFIDANEAKSMHKSKSGKCGSGKCGEGKCCGDKAKTVVSDKVDEAKTDVKEAKCGEGKCG